MLPETILVDELIAADRYLIATPIFNFTVPSTLKAYIDQIVRIGRTVTMDENNFNGLLQKKKVLVIASQGGIATALAVAIDSEEIETWKDWI